MVSNQCSVLPHCQSVSTHLPLHILFSSSQAPLQILLPCLLSSAGQLPVSILSAWGGQVPEKLCQVFFLVAWYGGVAHGNAVLLEKPCQEYSFFFVILTVVVCSHVFPTAANEIVSKIKRGKAVNGQVNSCRAKNSSSWWPTLLKKFLSEAKNNHVKN